MNKLLIKILFCLNSFIFLFFLPSLSLSLDAQKLSYNKISIKLHRGAFHYDSFILTNDGLIKLDSPKVEKGNPYASQTVQVEPEKIKRLAQIIVKEGFFNLESEYKDTSSCQSTLVIEVNIDKLHKKVSCSDYQRGCPKLMYQIEEKLINLQGKGLKRTWLPG